ncbi:hypothetical protein BDN71DRAFT_782806 [Pleurotus eryngii]|uniref:RING-CH-type domain-containing protein n=1 Tax=Pleurotus eryngii TaxID=5323 RepID=A0A9P6A1G4_PLEER|nr:hypothetical protein BDN71DRAFT_782806 [Pleurotus eryngii]
MPPTPSTETEEKQCRICLDGVDAEPELGRLFRPCLCRGSISYVHVKCLQQWRNTSSSRVAFFSCPQCHYQYRFARTQALGIATNPIIVGCVSAILFTMIVLLASFITTFFMSAFEEPTYYGSSWFYYFSPFDATQDLVRAALRIIQDETGADILHDTPHHGPPFVDPVIASPGILKRFIRRFLLGLPIVGASSLVHMFLSAPFIGPVHWLARYRGNRRRDNSRDIAALIIVGLLVLGALRALWKVYGLTESLTKRILLRAGDAILEVN